MLTSLRGLVCTRFCSAASPCSRSSSRPSDCSACCRTRVAQRSRELAVRTALGARPVDIVRLVLGHTLAVTGVGLAAGLLGSLALTRSIGALLYGITPHDGITYAGVSIVVIVVAAAASFGPARRAAHLDPTRLLRDA